MALSAKLEIGHTQHSINWLSKVCITSIGLAVRMRMDWIMKIENLVQYANAIAPYEPGKKRRGGTHTANSKGIRVIAIKNIDIRHESECFTVLKYSDYVTTPK